MIKKLVEKKLKFLFYIFFFFPLTELCFFNNILSADKIDNRINNRPASPKSHSQHRANYGSFFESVNLISIKEQNGNLLEIVAKEIFKFDIVSNNSLAGKKLISAMNKINLDEKKFSKSELRRKVIDLMGIDTNLFLRNLENGQASNISSENCNIDNKSNALSSVLDNVRKDLGNGLEIKKIFDEKINEKVLTKRVTDLFEKILENDYISDVDRNEFLETLWAVEKLILWPNIQKIHQVKSYKFLNLEEVKKLKKFVDYLSIYDSRKLGKNLEEHVLLVLNDRILARRIFKFKILIEFYNKYVRSMLKNNGSIESIELYGLNYSHKDFTYDSIKTYLFGNVQSNKQQKNISVSNKFEEIANSEMEQKKALNDRLSNDKNFASKQSNTSNLEYSRVDLIKSAKYFHNRYLMLYNEMLSKCYFAYNNILGCRKASNNFRQIGVDLYLRKMFDLMERSQIDKGPSRLQEIQQARLQYVGDLEKSSPKLQYSLFNEEDKYGEYSTYFPKAIAKDKWGQKFFEGHPLPGTRIGRTPTGVSPSFLRTDYLLHLRK